MVVHPRINPNTQPTPPPPPLLQLLLLPPLPLPTDTQASNVVAQSNAAPRCLPLQRHHGPLPPQLPWPRKDKQQQASRATAGNSNKCMKAAAAAPTPHTPQGHCPRGAPRRGAAHHPAGGATRPQRLSRGGEGEKEPTNTTTPKKQNKKQTHCCGTHNTLNNAGLHCAASSSGSSSNNSSFIVLDYSS